MVFPFVARQVGGFGHRGAQFVASLMIRIDEPLSHRSGRESATGRGLGARSCEEQQEAATWMPRLEAAWDEIGVESHAGKRIDEEENVEVLMCFVCGCKHLHHKGFRQVWYPTPRLPLLIVVMSGIP